MKKIVYFNFMHNYSRTKGASGKTAYRTPSRFKNNRLLAVRGLKAKAFGDDPQWRNKLENKF